MCGIVGYVGPQAALEVVVEGLRRLEYRGYDSAGVAIVADGELSVAKKAGKLGNLEKLLAEQPMPRNGLGIGHTRWATHGAPNDVNAHPHTSSDGRIAAGAQRHRGELRGAARPSCATPASRRGPRPTPRSSPTCSASRPRHGVPLDEAMRTVCRRLHGAFTLVAVDRDNPDVVVAARRNSPLVVGVGQGENFLASDVAAFIEHTREAIELGQDQIVADHPGRRRGHHLRRGPGRGSAVPRRLGPVRRREGRLRLVHAQGDLRAAQGGRRHPARPPHRHGKLTLDEIRIPEAQLRSVDKIVVVACGTAFYAGLVAKYAIEHWTRIPCEVELASEFRYRDPIVGPTTLVVAISQSGETADTLMAIRHAREQRARVLAICNTNGSTIPRESDAVIYTHAGPEIGVASTKGFLTQLVACYLLGLYLAQVRGTKFGDEIKATMRELQTMPGAITAVLDDIEPVLKLAEDFVDEPTVLFFGRHVGYPVALEGALKLKELAYIHAEGFAAGELKHGPIALIEDRLPVFVVIPPGAATCCTTRCSPTCRRCAPAGRGRWCWPRRTTTRSCRTRTC